MGRRYLSHKEIRKTIKEIEKFKIPLTIYEVLTFGVCNKCISTKRRLQFN